MIKKGLGRGLGALLPDSMNVTYRTEDGELKTGVVELDINKIEPNKQQPRKNFDPGTLNELAESIRQFGVIQPLIVKAEEGYYSIIAGERRWRAARIAKLKTVPVIVKDYNEVETIEIALIENIQRADLNPIEEAACFKRLIDEYYFTHERLAERVSKNRSTITNSLRMLNLDIRVQNFVAEGKISSGHARALLAMTGKDDQFAYAERIVEGDLSVRRTEQMVRQYFDSADKKAETKDGGRTGNSVFIGAMERELGSFLGTKVSIRDNGKNKGRIEIEYYSGDDLERLAAILKP